MKARISRVLPKLSPAIIALVAIAPSQVAVAQTKLNGAGATFPYPLYSKWFDVYKQATGVQINYQSVGSGAGIKQLTNKTVDFGASDAPLTNADLTAMPGKVIQIPTVAGAIAVVFNVPGVSNLKLSGPLVADIFQGKVTKWNDSAITSLNPGVKLPSTAITVARRSDGSGTTFIYTSYLASVSASWKNAIGAGKSVDWPVGLGGKGNDGVANIVRSTSGGIGYVELAYAHQNKINYASIRNKSGVFVEPSVAGATASALAASKATARDQRALIVNQTGPKVYPISGYTFILYYADSTKTPRGKEVIKFLKWAMVAGQKYAAPLDYAPLPRAVVSVNNSKLK